eukprot:CAMPEP_0182442586 /NCGR_PEP_ID=MMETSP1172-20130603/1499_1 /TAXON_ID=708627 /ORGANISM="Timspurckia oligopyrenoides, Strain CCMP3278" /LENGTH=647 /DNA_ID=CAMNT_0024637531 /DNA_START=94 /DNA_END=2037 /DNA_ORIENTATION=+
MPFGNLFSRDKDTHAVVSEDKSSHGGDADAAAAELFANLDSSSRIMLSFRCHNLPNMDAFSKSDPFLVIKLDGIEIGRTEVIADNLNPEFVSTVDLTYKFEEVQKLTVLAYDADTVFNNANAKALDLSKQDFLGSSECELASIITASGGQKKLPLVLNSRKKSRAAVTVISQEIPEQNKLVNLQIQVQDLPRMKASAPYFKISRLHETSAGSTSILAYKSEVKPKIKNPLFNAAEMSLRKLSGGDTSSPLRIEFFNWVRGGKHSYIGEIHASIAELESACELRNLFPIVDKKSKAKKSTSKPIGFVSVAKCSIREKPSFFAYIAGGCEMAFTVAIDFTASNGDPSVSSSLHYLSGNQRGSPYSQAIDAIGHVLQHYDTDKKFPVYGFGAVLGWRGDEKSHCFAVNGNESNPEVDGIEGIKRAYEIVLPLIKLSGPTLFTEIIQAAAARADSENVNQSHQVYQVLLILTDGVLNDMDATKNAIVRASSLGISIIIVGIGNADFTNMNILDGDEIRLKGSAGIAKRDIVQFVQYNKYLRPDGSLNSAEFSRAVLDEIPAQVVDYFESQKITPNPPTLARVASSYGTGSSISGIPPAVLPQEYLMQQGQMHAPAPYPSPIANQPIPPPNPYAGFPPPPVPSSTTFYPPNI